MQLELFDETGVAKLDIDGSTYEPEHDSVRLGRQALAVFELMKDGSWRTLREITEAIGVGSEAGVSARLRGFARRSVNWLERTNEITMSKLPFLKHEL